MQFFLIALLASLLSVAFSAPVQIAKRAPRTYAQLSIGGGVGGNALAEAQAKFPGNPATLSKATVSDFNVRPQPYLGLLAKYSLTEYPGRRALLRTRRRGIP
jgi:hypothetical protein